MERQNAAAELPYRNILLTICFCIVVIVFSGCSKSEGDWKEASRTNSIEAYQLFITNHPASGHVAAAKVSIALIREQQLKNETLAIANEKKLRQCS